MDRSHELLHGCRVLRKAVLFLTKVHEYRIVIQSQLAERTQVVHHRNISKMAMSSTSGLSACPKLVHNNWRPGYFTQDGWSLVAVNNHEIIFLHQRV